MNMRRLEKFLAVFFLVAVVLSCVSLYLQNEGNKGGKYHVCCSANACARDHHHAEKKADLVVSEKSPYNRYRDSELRTTYDQYNQDWFAEVLPKNTTVIYSDLTPWKELGAVDRRADGTWLVRIDRQTNPTLNSAYMTLLHELCHVKLGIVVELKIGGSGWDEHGHPFQACMIDLANKGAFERIW
jgi:hypothetical protein